MVAGGRGVWGVERYTAVMSEPEQDPAAADYAAFERIAPTCDALKQQLADVIVGQGPALDAL